MAVVVKTHVGQLQYSPALHVHLPVSVHQDVADTGIGQQRLERSQAEDFVQHFVRDLLLLGRGHQGRLFLHHGQDGFAHLRADTVVVDARQRVQVDAFQQLAVERELQLLVFQFESPWILGVA